MYFKGDITEEEEYYKLLPLGKVFVEGLHYDFLLIVSCSTPEW